jgi:hypothetical protein
MIDMFSVGTTEKGIQLSLVFDDSVPEMVTTDI